MYMWENVDKTVKIIESWIDLISKTAELYDPQYCLKKWTLFTQIFSYYLRICANKKPHDFMYEYKSLCTSINERFFKLEYCLHSIWKNKSKKFIPFGNEFLTPSKNTTLTDYHNMSSMKQRYLCEYDPRCIMSSGLMFDKIIIDIITNNKLAHPIEENDCLFT